MAWTIGGEPDAPPDLGTEMAVRRYLMYGLLPAWFVPGILDWRLPKRTRTEETSGLRESLIHTLMMTEVGVRSWGRLILQVNRRLFAVMGVAAVVHEATAIWDVRTAYDSTHEVAPNEQHVHALLGVSAVHGIGGTGRFQRRERIRTSPVVGGPQPAFPSE